MRTLAVLLALLAPVDVSAVPPQDLPGGENVNARYVVERAEIRGVARRELTPELVEELRSLEGKTLDAAEAVDIERRIRQGLTGYDLRRRIRRGSETGRIRVIYEAVRRDRERWIRFQPTATHLVYHSDQGWGSFLDLAFGSRSIRVTPLLAFGVNDDLVEEYSGFGVRFETRRMGTRRLGASLEWTSFDQDWEDATRAAATRPGLAPLYEERTTLAPMVRFAVTPQLTVGGGVSITELEPLSGAATGEASTMANALVAALEYVHRFTGDGARAHNIGANFSVRAGRRALESDLAYTRYAGGAGYRYGHGRHRVDVSAMAGAIDGTAPMFERFALGDSRTLRGWNKYDVAPAGGDRTFHSSLAYGYGGVGLFLDIGSVWDAGSDRKTRVSTGIQLEAGPAFFTVGFPVNTDDLRAVFTMGLRMSGARVGGER